MHSSHGREHWHLSPHSLASLFICLSCMPRGGCQSITRWQRPQLSKSLSLLTLKPFRIKAICKLGQHRRILNWESRISDLPQQTGSSDPPLGWHGHLIIFSFCPPPPMVGNLGTIQLTLDLYSLAAYWALERRLVITAAVSSCKQVSVQGLTRALLSSGHLPLQGPSKKSSSWNAFYLCFQQVCFLGEGP